MKKLHSSIAVAIAVALAISGCGYFNTLYNARRQFSDAERARERGDVTTARQGYIGTIEKAAKSYRKYPDGRWADDALYLIARGRFQLGEFASARLALQQLLAQTDDSDVRAGALAYAGAAEVRLGAPDAALVYLDSAATQIEVNSTLTGFVRLWRARARVSLNDVAGAWHDLDALTARTDPEFGAVQLERIGLAIAAGDSARLRNAFAGVLSGRDARRTLDTLNDLALAAAPSFGAAAVRSMLTTPPSELVGAAHDSLALIAAQIAVRAGDTLAAHRELSQLAGGATGPIAAAARIALARSRLQTAARLEQLSEIRALLLPALPAGEALVTINNIRMVDVLVQRSMQTGQPLAIFTAAEIARDELGAPQLARQLFITFADVGAQTPWAAKAILAAIALDADAPEANDLRARLQKLPPNPYSTVTRGEDAEEAYETAEERLARSVIALKGEAISLAQQQEGAVSRAVFVLDSIRIAAKTDTLRAACGLMIDTLAITGIRADTVRTACMRSDSATIALALKIDTMIWRRGPQSADSIPRRGRRTPTSTRDSIK